MSIAQQLNNKSFPNGAVKSIKSQSYLSGVLETLEFKETGFKLKNSFELSSSESDAWNAGNREGHGLWSDNQHDGEVMSSSLPSCSIGATHLLKGNAFMNAYTLKKFWLT